MNGADTAWIIVATALVLFMTLPGLALFYGGLVRARNVLSVFYALLCNCLFDERAVACLWLFNCLWQWHQRLLGRIGQNVPIWRDNRQPK